MESVRQLDRDLIPSAADLLARVFFNNPAHVYICPDSQVRVGQLEWFLESLAPEPRAYSEVIEVWRTSCPRLPVWEEASDRGLISRDGSLVALTPVGREHLAKRRGE